MALIDPHEPRLTIARQAELLDISRSSVYYVPRVNPEEKRIMDEIDAVYTEFPFYGSRRIADELHDRGIAIGRDRTRSLMREMGIEALYPKPKTSIPDVARRIYPYLLRNVRAAYPNHIWGTDITYIRLEYGWAYLMAIIDWFSRYVIAWELSSTMESDFCAGALEKALATGRPAIHNSDQGSQFTAKEYIGILQKAEVAISMDGRGRCMDNIFTERLWRTVKYEDVYPKSYRTIEEARTGLDAYFTLYNTRRKHEFPEGYRTPAEVYGIGRQKEASPT